MAKLITAVRAALRGRTHADPRDVAAERLALTYAELIDNAAPAARYRKALGALTRAVEAYEGLDAEDAAEALHTVADALAEHSVASDLGPKLTAVLTALRLTTAARGAAKDGGKRAEPSNPLDELKARRAARG
jgi:hypothetical protein